MTQATGNSGRALYVALSTDGSTFTDISGHANSVEPDGGERSMGETHTAEGDTPIVTKGKRAAMNVKAKVIYTEATTGPHALVKAAYEAGSALYLRWAPLGNVSGGLQNTTSAGTVTTHPYQGVADVGDAKALLLEFNLMAASITQATIA